MQESSTMLPFVRTLSLRNLSRPDKEKDTSPLNKLVIARSFLSTTPLDSLRKKCSIELIRTQNTLSTICRLPEQYREANPRKNDLSDNETIEPAQRDSMISAKRMELAEI